MGILFSSPLHFQHIQEYQALCLECNLLFKQCDDDINAILSTVSSKNIFDDELAEHLNRYPILSDDTSITVESLRVFLLDLHNHHEACLALFYAKMNQQKVCP